MAVGADGGKACCQAGAIERGFALLVHHGLVQAARGTGTGAVCGSGNPWIRLSSASRTVSDASQVDEELRCLPGLLSRPPDEIKPSADAAASGI